MASNNTMQVATRSLNIANVVELQSLLLCVQESHVGRPKTLSNQIRTNIAVYSKPILKGRAGYR